MRARTAMNIGQLCNRNPITVRRSAELIEAAQLMRANHIGYLVVVDADIADQLPRPAGVITDRDIVISVIARETDPRTLHVGDVMTPSPVTVGAAEPVDRALREMRRTGVRRMPVV